MRFIRSIISSILLFTILAASLALASNLLPSKLEGDYLRQVYEQVLQTPESQAVLSEALLATLPEPLRVFYRQIGYLDRPMAKHLQMQFGQVEYTPAFSRPYIKLEWQQDLWADQPLRFAYGQGNLALATFETLEAYRALNGEKKEVLGRYFQTGGESGLSASRTQLVGWLADSIWLPQAALSGRIVWEAIDPQHLRASLSDGALNVSGVFEFNADGLLSGFFSQDGQETNRAGRWEITPWTLSVSDYVPQNGLQLPRNYQLSWKFPEGSYAYLIATDLRFIFE